MISWRHAIRRALLSGSSASILSTAALMAGGQRDCSSTFAPVNAISHWLWKGRAIRQDRPSLRYSLVGYGIHHAMSILWAITYEKLVGLHRGSAPQGAANDASSGPKHEAGPTVVMLRRPDGKGKAEGAHEPDRSEEPDAQRASNDSDKGRALGDVPLLPVLATAAVVAAGACLVDLRCTPQRLTPGFERRLTPSSLFLAYTAFGLGLALCDSVSALRRR